MFRKIVSNISFSPALVGQLGFYAKRLRKEEATRRVGLIFTALALVVQSFAVFSPPEPANAASSNDFVRGGVKDLGQFLGYYDSNHNGIKDLYTDLGITREELAATKPQSLNSKSGVYSWGLNPRFSAAQGEGSYTVGAHTYHYRPLQLWDSTSYTKANGSTYEAYVGHSTKIGWFAIIKNCANLALKTPPPPPPPQICPPGTTGTYPNCSTPLKQTISCSSLAVSQVGTRYSYVGASSPASTVAIQGYTYTTKKDGKVVDTQRVTTTEKTSTHSYTTTEQGTYTVELTVHTAQGDKSGSDCVKTFTVPAPEMCPVNPSLRKDDPACQPCPGDATLWVKDEKCSAQIIQTKTAKNAAQGGVDATTTTAKASDRITYTITMENKGLNDTDVTFKEDVSDIIEYAEVFEPGGGTYDKEAKTITWPAQKIKSKESLSRMFTVQLASTVPAAAQGTSDRAHYDCIMTNTFGNSVSINVDCPTPKQVEQVVTQLPHTGPTENLLFGGTLLAVVAFFYARSRQLKKEVRLIRRDVNTGTI